MITETWAVRDELWVVRRFRFAHLIVEIDSVFVYNALCRKPVQAGQLSRMLHEVQVLVFKFSSLQDTFCYIRVADLSANNATTQKKKKNLCFT